jgi:hypothetical protein
MNVNAHFLEEPRYDAPNVEVVYLSMEGVIADSCYPTIKNNKVYYEPYTSDSLETPTGQDIVIF